MTGDVRLRPPRAVVCCLGVLLVAAVMGLYAQLAGPGGAPVPQQVVVLSTAEWIAGSGGDAADPGARSDAGLPVLPGVAGVARAVVTTAGGPVAPVAGWFVLPGLVLSVVVVSGPRILGPRVGAQQHRTRAPPVRA